MKEKKIIVTLFAVMFLMSLTSCSKDDDNIKDNKEYKALFYTTDMFVKDLGYSGSKTDSETTSDGNYIVTVLGRLVIVKKNTITGPSYNEVRDALYAHYLSNSIVKDVFINNGGTVTIDCRK